MRKDFEKQMEYSGQVHMRHIAKDLTVKFINRNSNRLSRCAKGSWSKKGLECRKQLEQKPSGTPNNRQATQSNNNK